MAEKSIRHVAAAILIDTQGRLLLQQRDSIPSILFPGKIGLFGGHREGAETFLECVVREIEEELSYFVAPYRFEHLATYIQLDPDAEGAPVHGELFIARDVPVDVLTITEGSLVIADQNNLGALKNLTHSGEFAIRIFLERL